MSSNDGGPAFPVKTPLTELYATGLTIRDWFAGQVLAGTVLETEDTDDERLARRCYEVADAMLAEREKGGAT